MSNEKSLEPSRKSNGKRVRFRAQAPATMKFELEFPRTHAAAGFKHIVPLYGGAVEFGDVLPCY